MWKISEEGLQNLKNHKYQGSKYTFLDNIMNHFWMYLVNFLPIVNSIEFGTKSNYFDC